mgnify:CR=1 FL=1
MLLKKINKILDYWPNQLAIISFFIMLIISIFLTYRIYNNEYGNELLKAKEESFKIKNQIESTINYSSNMVKVLSFIVEKDLEDQEFEPVAKSLVKKNEYVDALQLVKGFKIIKTYPLTGNEKSLGYDLNSNPYHKKAANEAIAKNKIFFEGPFKLIQGGMGIVGREPIYKNGEFWGFSAVIIKTETFLKAIHLEESGKNSNFEYQIVQKENDLNGPKFFKNDADFSKGIIHKTFLSSGDWYLYVKLNEPKYLDKSIEFLVYGIVLSIIIALYLRKLAEEPIKLETLVEIKTADLEKLNIELENRAKELTKVNKELEYFAYIISHDLQEPLRMITSFLTQLEKKYNDALDDKGRKYIFFAVDGAKRMKNIILDILEFSRVGKYNDKKEAINLNEIVQEMDSFYKMEFPHGKLIYENLPTLNSYKSPLIQIFQNLISNAFKYAKENEAPIVAIKVVEENDKQITFAVQDNGIGIENEYLEKIFVLFQRLHVRDGDKGSGMGLAIVKKIVENLNGTIWAVSKVNVGSTFYFTLPKE